MTTPRVQVLLDVVDRKPEQDFRAGPGGRPPWSGIGLGEPGRRPGREIGEPAGTLRREAQGRHLSLENMPV